MDAHRSLVPEISRFLGIVVLMYYGDHPPPHVHVRYGEYRGILEIEGLELLAGYLPRRVLGLATEWAALHQAELRKNWRSARAQAPLLPIAPLE